MQEEAFDINPPYLDMCMIRVCCTKVIRGKKVKTTVYRYHSCVFVGINN